MLNKYHAKRVWACKECLAPAGPVTSRKKGALTCSGCGADGVVCFASTGEFDRWCELRMLERVNTIRNLEYQPVFKLIVNGTSIGKYTADAAYFEGNARIVEEFKGMETREGKLRRRLAEAIYRMSVTVVK